MEKTLKTAKN